MSNPMRTRIAAHLTAMGLKASSQPMKDALVANGLHKTYLYEFMSGKKDTIAPKSLPMLAKALGVSVGFIDGSEVQHHPAQIKIGGICEEGTWRAPTEVREARAIYLPDSRVDPSQQIAYVVRGDRATSLGIVEGSVVIVGIGLPPRAGEITLVERTREDGMRETLLRKHEVKSANTFQPKFTEQVIGVVLLSIKRF